MVLVHLAIGVKRARACMVKLLVKCMSKITSSVSVKRFTESIHTST